MKSKSSVIVDYGVTCICSALKSDYDVRLAGEKICNLALALVAPVSTNYCRYRYYFLRKNVLFDIFLLFTAPIITDL